MDVPTVETGLAPSSLDAVGDAARRVSAEMSSTRRAPTESPRLSLPRSDPSVPSIPLQSSPAPGPLPLRNVRPHGHCHRVPVPPLQSPLAPLESARTEFCCAPEHSGSFAETLSDHPAGQPAACPSEPQDPAPAARSAVHLVCSLPL